MSSFTKAVVEIDDSVDPCVFILNTELQYHVGSFPSEEIINVNKGFRSDLASVPRWLWSIFPPHGNYAKAAILHDYLYVNAIGTKKYADKIFYEAMKVEGVRYIKRNIIYLGAKLFGKGSYE